LVFYEWHVSFEMSGPDYLNPDSYRPMVRMVFDMCLCCFTYNPEIWLSVAHFERGEQQEATIAGTDAAAIAATAAAGVEKARAVYVEAIDANPSAVLLRCALAELEESVGME
jgi:hypothetical protein